MKAMRWILFCLLAFGLGTGVAFAMHPPTVGIPKSDASDLAGDLSAIKKYAAIGHCDAVRGRLASASRTISDLPVSTNANTQRQLTDALENVRSSAISTCEQVADAKLEAKQPTTPETTPTTPDATPTPTQTPTPSATPSPTPSPADGSGTTLPPSGGASPDGTSPDSGSGDGSDQGGGENSGGAGIELPNGVQVPSGNQIRQRLNDARRQIERALNP